jgi:riboflavin synthase
MFTGLVAELGSIRRVQRGALGARFDIACSFAGLALGESVATDGVCLTVAELVPGGFLCDASAETLSKTTLSAASAGKPVHLERALRLGDRLGGHLVSGHVDGVGKLLATEPLGEALKVVLEVPERLAPFLAPKGSITVDGVSLTVNGAQGTRFDVVLVQFTRGATHLDRGPLGKSVNLEVDVLAKYVARLFGRPGVDGLPASDEGGSAKTGDAAMLDLLSRSGYL